MKTFVTLGGNVGGSVRETPRTPVGPERRDAVDTDWEEELDVCVAKIEVVSVTVILVVLICTNITPTIKAMIATAPITPTVKIFRLEFIRINNTLFYVEHLQSRTMK